MNKLQYLRNGCALWLIYFVTLLFMRRYVPFEEFMNMMEFEVVKRRWYGNTYKYVGKK